MPHALGNRSTSPGSKQDLRRPKPSRRVGTGDLAQVLDDDRMYAAVCDRDAAQRGAFYLGVKTTGIFCAPGCAARTPLRANCEFFPSMLAALQAGYRACKRCEPMREAADRGAAPPWAGAIIGHMIEHPDQLLGAGELRQMGTTPDAASRYFKARFGASVQALSRAARVGLVVRWLRSGGEVRGALKSTGFASESGLRKAVSEVLGVSLAAARKNGPTPLMARWMETPLGPMLGVASQAGLCFLEFVDRRGLATQLETLRRRFDAPISPGDHEHLRATARWLGAYFNSGSAHRDLAALCPPLDTPGTELQSRVWAELLVIRSGTTISYGELAKRIGNPKAARAAARAVGENRIALVIPCHRVIGADGSLTGYAGGLDRKRWLLEHEAGPTLL